MHGFKGVKMVYRVANGAADGLAKWAYGTSTGRYFQDYMELPVKVQKSIFINRTGMPYYRPKCNRDALFLVKANNIF